MSAEFIITIDDNPPLTIGENMNLADRFTHALAWVKKHSPANQGVCISSQERALYPEVSGYFIPSLLAWGEQDLAMAYGAWLLRCQRDNGAWLGFDGKPYVFDTGQILKGLLALDVSQPGNPALAASIRSAADWITGYVADDGSMFAAPDIQAWGSAVPHGVLLYALQAVKQAAERFLRNDWREKHDKAVAWFLRQKSLTCFTHLSHFHAYILESLCDLGYSTRASEGMAIVSSLQRSDGAVPAYANVRWICSTGLFQYAIVWYKLGDKQKADTAFDFSVHLQNESGGWYGSYPQKGFFAKLSSKNKPTYFPQAEISWAVKYFLDALRQKLYTESLDHIVPEEFFTEEPLLCGWRQTMNTRQQMPENTF